MMVNILSVAIIDLLTALRSRADDYLLLKVFLTVGDWQLGFKEVFYYIKKVMKSSFKSFLLLNQ